MTISQISVFAESKPGRLASVLDTFEGAGVSVRGFSVSDTGEFGITRFIVDKPEVALDALKQAGNATAKTDVVCCKLIDIPGELAKVTKILNEASQNILYSYSMISTYVVIFTDDAKEAEEVLKNAGIEIVSQDEISSEGSKNYA